MKAMKIMKVFMFFMSFMVGPRVPPTLVSAGRPRSSSR